jgi:hypothetical protein
MAAARTGEIDMKRLLLFLLLVSSAFALDCIENATAWILQEQGLLIVAVLILTTLIIAISYVVGSFTGNVNFTVFAKDELYHLGFSVVLLLFFGTILLFSCDAIEMFYNTIFDEIGPETTPSLCYSSTATMGDVSLCYMQNLKSKSSRLAETYIDEYIGQLMYSTWTFSLSLPLMNSYSVSAGAYKRIWSAQYDTVLNMFILPALISINIQEMMLTLVVVEFVKWLFPIAFLLRIFIPTRQMGNMLIALGMGLHLVVPFFYVFNLAMYDILFQDCTVFPYVAPDGDVEYITNDFVFGPCGDPGSFWQVASLIPQAFFLPNLTIALVVAFMVSVNKALRVIG